MKSIPPVIAMALAIVGIVLGNGLGGQRLERVVGHQIVDIGTDQPTAPQAGAPIQFDFNLLKSDTREPLPSTNVDVAIAHKGTTVLDSDLVMEPPLTLLVYTFAEGGNYDLKVTFYNKDQQLATASFPLTIGGFGGTMRALYIAAIFVSVILGLLAGYWGGRRRAAG